MKVFIGMLFEFAAEMLKNVSIFQGHTSWQMNGGGELDRPAGAYR